MFACHCWTIICGFSNPSASRGRSFCASSNMLLGSMLVMFLTVRLWPVGACAFHSQPAKQNLRMSTKLAFPPTFILPVAKFFLPMCHKMIWLALFTERCLSQPIITYRGANSMLVKIASLTSDSQLQQLFLVKGLHLQRAQLMELILSQNPISAVNKCYL